MRKHSSTKNPNHPRKGSAIKVDPIRRVEDVNAIKSLLEDVPRDYCLFIMGINTAYRANELVSLNVGQVAHLVAGDLLQLKQSKNNRYRSATLNQVVIDALDRWLDIHPQKTDEAPLFISQSTGLALRANTITKMVKRWCAEINLPGNYGSHSLRKTFGYHQRARFNQPVPLLMAAFGHSSEQQTLDYLCIQPKEVSALYSEAI